MSGRLLRTTSSTHLTLPLDISKVGKPPSILTSDQVQRKDGRLAAELSEARFEAIVSQDFVLTEHCAAIYQHHFARHTGLIRLLRIAGWNIVEADIELGFNHNRRSTIGLIRHCGTSRGGHNQLQVEVLKHHVRIGIADRNAENLRIIRLEMVL